MFDWGTVLVAISLLLLCGVMYIYLSGKSHAFWTGGPIRRAILNYYMRIR